MSKKIINLNEHVRFRKDADFYDKYISGLPLWYQAKYFEEHPEFMQYDEESPKELKVILQKILEQKR